MKEEMETDGVVESLLNLSLNRDASLRSRFGMLLAKTEEPEFLLQQIKLIDLVSVETESSAETQAELAELLRKGVDTSALGYLRDLRRFQRGFPEVDLDVVWGRPYYGFPLILAVMQNLPQVLGILLAAPHVNTEVVDEDGMTATHRAAQLGAVKCLEQLLEAGAECNATVPNRPKAVHNRVAGFTPLHMALMEKQAQCVVMLLHHGVDHNATNAVGETCLYLAARLGHPNMVMALLKNAYGVPVLSYPTPYNEDTPLHACLRNGKKMTECVRELVRHQADVICPNRDGLSALQIAVQRQWSVDIIELLILRGYNMDFARMRRPTFRCGCGCSSVYDNPLCSLMMEWCGCPGEANYTLPYIKGTLPNLAILFLQTGATPLHTLTQTLLHMLQCKSVAAGDPLLSTLMDCFAYLPPLAHLLLLMPQQKTTSKGKMKHWLYLERQREVPSLAHLSRCSIRRVLGMRMCDVVRLPVPQSVKEYILLGRRLPPPLKVVE